LGFVWQVRFRGGTMIRFQCPHCGAKLQVSETHAEKEGPCPRCQKRLKVPPAPEAELRLVKVEATDNAPIPSKLLDQVAVGPQPIGKDSDSPEDRLAQRLYDSLGRDSAQEHTGARQLPWPIDVLLYPASIGGLTTLIILVGIPFLIGLVPMFGLAGWLIRVAINLYSAWYLAEYVYDSAKGGTRAPMALDTTDLGVMWSRVLYLMAVYILFVFPAGIYWTWTRQRDPIFWGLVAWAVVFFPMGLLAMVIHDSTSALNPFFLLGAIFRTFLPYLGLIFLMGISAALGWGIASLLPEASRWRWLLQAPVSFATTYLSFVAAHVLGRFYWRYRDRLDWGI
jgi:hypothetical protein